ncbi:MAG: hypothetical protein L6265_08290 [Thermoplasmatales archaeon]|nr:hypothetical protein [Thermoplasmatales archaeon]
MVKGKYVKEHLRVKKGVEKVVKESRSSCVPVSNLSIELRMDPRTVRKHLEVLNMDGVGSLRTGKAGYFFCLKKKKARVEK